jgi:phosphohistidine swiveling domain-containing protein
MNFNEVLDEIKKHSWWIESGPAVLQVFLYPLYGFITQSRVFDPDNLKITIFVFNNDFVYEITPEDEKYQVYQYIVNRVKKDKDYLINKRRDSTVLMKKVQSGIENFERNKDQFDNKQLWLSYKDFIDNYRLYMEYGTGLECVDMYTEYHLRNNVKKELPDLDELKITDIVISLSLQLELSFMERERLDFLEICLKDYDSIINNKITSDFEEFSENYFWVLNNFKESRLLDKNYFFEKAKEEIKDKEKIEKELNNLRTKISRLKKSKEDICKKYKISDELRLNFKILENIGAWIDERKGNMIYTAHYILEFCKEISKRFSLGDKINYYHVGDIENLLLNNKKVDDSEIGNRRSFSAYVMTKLPENDLQIDIFYGKQAEEILDKTSHKLSDSIFGQVASAPVEKMEGNVQIILDANQQEFKKGNILVTTMTRPEFVPLMRKASAIITDEGGITCHAAIVSRELKIPCLIGTKIATKALKTGDFIEMDMIKGIVRKINK